MGSEAGLSRSRCARYQNAGAQKESAHPQHLIEARDPRGDDLPGCVVCETRGGDGQDRDATAIYEEWIFVGAMRGAAVFDDAQASGSDLVIGSIVQEDYAVRDIFFQAESRQRTAAALRGNDRGDLLILEPCE